MAEKRILVAYDETELSEKALQMGIDFVRGDSEAILEVAYVAPIPNLAIEDLEKYADLIDMLTEDCRDVLYKAQSEMEGIEGRYETLMVKGSDPAAELLKLVAQKQYYLIIIGSRGLSGIKEYIGSVSHKVLHGADVPVLIVK